MEKEKLIIIGTGPNGKNAYKFIKRYGLFDILGFAVNAEYKISDTFLDLPVYEIEYLENIIDKDKTYLFAALLWNRLNADRKDLYLSLKERGYKFANLISPKASIHGAIAGDNCWIHDFVTIQSDTVIKNNIAILPYSLVCDNCVIGDHCFLGAKATIGGGTEIGEQTFVGMNCTVFDDTKVGKKCILGACAAVKRNVPDNSVYKTSSDMVIKQYDENEIEQKLLYRKNIR